MEELVEKIEPRLETEGLNYETVESQKEDTSRSLKDLTQFLALISFIALLLGCIGVASAIHIYVREKINSVAILRCLGRKGFAGISYLPDTDCCNRFYWFAGRCCFRNDHPTVFTNCVERFFTCSYYSAAFLESIGQGLLLGIVISFLFALLPLISIRNVSPLNTLRLSFQTLSLFKDPVKWLVYLAIMLFIFGFSYHPIRRVCNRPSLFLLGVLIAFLILVAIAALLMWAVRRFFPDAWSYLWRQGLANLFRPNNQTTILIVAIGLGTAFICTMFSVQSILLNRVMLSASGNQSNTILFDIQPLQKDSVIALARQQGLPIDGTVPIVNMRLEKVNNITVETLRERQHH